MIRKNFIMVKVVGTVVSSRTRILNTDWIKSIYQSDDDNSVRVDLHEDGRSYTLKVKHSMKEMWGKVRGVHV